jgi:hypothetical protein
MSPDFEPDKRLRADLEGLVLFPAASAGWRDVEERARKKGWIPESERQQAVGDGGRPGTQTSPTFCQAAATIWSGGLRTSVAGLVILVILAAVATGVSAAVRHLGGNGAILVITDATTPTSAPGQVSGLAKRGAGTASERPSTVAAGQWHSLCVGADGSLWAWGADGTGRSSNGNPAGHELPTRVGGGTGWRAVAAGEQHSLVLKSDGSLWAWGSNDFGQLGDGTANDRPTPARIGTDSDWVAVAAGGQHSLALRSDGSLWAWGRLSNSERVGVSVVVDPSSPTRIGSDSDWVAVAAGGNGSLGLKVDGSLWAWGAGVGDQWGDGSIYRNVPTRIGSDSDWLAIAAGGSHSLALKTDGSLWEWGTSTGDPLAEERATSYGSPTRVGSDHDWVAIATGGSHSLALKADGSLWAWGDNLFGAVGDGSSDSRSSPVRIGSDSDWAAIGAGSTHSLALKSDGSLWAWGQDFGGALGVTQSGGEQRAPVEVLIGASVP